MEKDKVMNLKLVPKDKPILSSWINYHMWELGPPLKNYIGQIIYMNYDNPGKKIFNPYYINSKAIASPLFTLDNTKKFDNPTKYTKPVMTLDELPYDAHIFFWTQENKEKHIKNSSK
jgi:hypothetical protein